MRQNGIESELQNNELNEYNKYCFYLFEIKSSLDLNLDYKLPSLQ